MISAAARKQALGLAAAILVAAGAGLAVKAALVLADASRRLEQKEQELEALQRIATDVSRLDAQEEAAGLFDESVPDTLTDLLEAAIPDYADAKVTPEAPVIRGLRRVHSRTITFQKVPVPGLMRFVRYAENARPRWKLVHCVMNASGSVPGYADATLVLEALGK